jgi:cellulose biosynthesis protein BcsQ
MATSAFANLKGGVGKTLVTLGTAHAAVAAGRRVLVVDCDPQVGVTAQLTAFTPDNPLTNSRRFKTPSSAGQVPKTHSRVSCSRSPTSGITSSSTPAPRPT